MDTVEAIEACPKDAEGWYVLPDGRHVKLGHDCRLGDGSTSERLNEAFCAAITSPVKYWKWVTKDRNSPNFDGGSPLHYEVGAVVEEPKAERNDQQCGPGLHVLRIPYRPEWVGLCESNHDLIPIVVEVQPEDHMFTGLPTMDAKIRVRKLRVLT